MAYSDDAVKSKLSSLNETQDSIVANAQWIMFHRRHADRTAALWLQKLQESPMAKRLVLVYLANEVVQQSRARGKQDFLLAFEPIIADATSIAYKGASQDAQGKVRRVAEVWRQRGIFDRSILDQVEARMAEIDKTRAGKSAGGAKLGGSLFGGGVGGGIPSGLEGVSNSAATLNKAEVAKMPAMTAAETDYVKMTDTTSPLPTPPVHAARLSALMKNLASAQGAVEASMQARKGLLSGLEKLLENHRASLAEEEAVASELAAKRNQIEIKKREVEDGIMRGLSTTDSPTAASANLNANGGSEMDPERPEAEGFTPPPPEIESFTPPLQPQPDPDLVPVTSDVAPAEHVLPTSTRAEPIEAQHPDPPTSYELPPALALSNGHRQPSNEIPADPRLKRRKMGHKPTEEELSEDLFGAGGLSGGVDEEGISALLGS